MKITDLTLTLFAWNDIPAVRYTSQNPTATSANSALGLVTIRTDSGPEGHAFLGAAFHSAEFDAAAVVNILRPVVIGQDPLERERLCQALYKRNRRASWRAIGAVDVALWDLHAKIAGLPLYKFLGAARTSLPAYASSEVLPSAEAYVEQALGFKAKGWTAYKMHPPTDPDQDVAICTALRKALGDGFPLMLDATWSYRYDQAMRVGRAIEELDFHWYEDPLADDNIEGYVRLKQHLHIPILATEYAPGSLASYAPWLMARATDFLRGDVAVKGGLTPCLKAAHLAEAFHLNYEIHHGGNSLNNVANLHLALAIPNCEYFEVLLPAAAQKYGLVNDIEVDRAGLVHGYEAPGLGAEIDFTLIERNKIAVLP